VDTPERPNAGSNHALTISCRATLLVGQLSRCSLMTGIAPVNASQLCREVLLGAKSTGTDSLTVTRSRSSGYGIPHSLRAGGRTSREDVPDPCVRIFVAIVAVLIDTWTLPKTEGQRDNTSNCWRLTTKDARRGTGDGTGTKQPCPQSGDYPSRRECQHLSCLRCSGQKLGAATYCW